MVFFSTFPPSLESPPPPYSRYPVDLLKSPGKLFISFSFGTICAVCSRPRDCSSQTSLDINNEEVLHIVLWTVYYMIIYYKYLICYVGCILCCCCCEADFFFFLRNLYDPIRCRRNEVLGKALKVNSAPNLNRRNFSNHLVAVAGLFATCFHLLTTIRAECLRVQQIVIYNDCQYIFK